ncbi:MAG: hypothetical protein EA425_10720 [Puniceicoccaceae bacterium]|nr:MAG: hypothetical protein EA425_10720 [Puniceicoccaceae bacterium]
MNHTLRPCFHLAAALLAATTLTQAASAGSPPEDRPPAPSVLAGDLATATWKAGPGGLLVLPDFNASDLPLADLDIRPAPGPQLVFSDMPEYFRTGDGIAMQEDVEAGDVRLYVYHVPTPDGGPKVITTVLENLGDAPLRISFQRYVFPTPDGYYLRIGKQGLIGFFEGGEVPEDRIVPPGGRIPVDPVMDQTIVSYSDLVHGFYEFSIDQPARLTVLQRDPEADSAAAVDTLPLLPRRLPDTRPSGAGRGLFPISNYEVEPAPGAAPLDTADGPRRILVADGRIDPWITGRDQITGLEDGENRGNYGVIYRIRIPLTSSDGRSWAVLMHNLYPHNQFCRAQASAVQVSAGKFPAGVVPIPAGQVFFREVGENVLLQIVTPSSDGEPAELELLYSPPGASCLPTPILLFPLEPGRS